MKYCSICRNEIQKDDRIAASSTETFVFNIHDPARPELNDGKDHTKTEMATTFITYDGNELDAKYFNLKHVVCSIPHPSGTHKIFSKNPLVKHSIRYTRSVVPKSNGREVHKH